MSEVSKLFFSEEYGLESRVERAYKFHGNAQYIIYVSQTTYRGIPITDPLFFTYEVNAIGMIPNAQVHILSNWVNITNGKLLPKLECLSQTDRENLLKNAYQTIIKQEEQHDSISENIKK